VDGPTFGKPHTRRREPLVGRSRHQSRVTWRSCGDPPWNPSRSTTPVDFGNCIHRISGPLSPLTPVNRPSPIFKGPLGTKDLTGATPVSAGSAGADTGRVDVPSSTPPSCIDSVSSHTDPPCRPGPARKPGGLAPACAPPIPRNTVRCCSPVPPLGRDRTLTRGRHVPYRSGTNGDHLAAWDQALSAVSGGAEYADDGSGASEPGLGPDASHKSPDRCALNRAGR
jgi:hypothetical protein